MNTLLNAIRSKQNKTTTENGAAALKTSLKHTVDFFGLGGALRSRNEVDIVSLFSKAFAENALDAIKILFYLRDVRKGQGERMVFRTCLKWLANEHPEAVIKNIENIIEFGRWDDLFSLHGTKIWKEYILSRIEFEWKNPSETPSLAWKWFPSENTSSKQTRALASEIRKHLGITPREYRKTLSAKRAALDIVERKMCSHQWSQIVYRRVPSKAALRYKDAFNKHDASRYQEYIADVKSGKTTINAGTLYPYDIVEKCLKGDSSHTLDVLWNSLPDYTSKEESKGIVVADVSGSMAGRPLSVSISLAMYIAERNKGTFKDSFITFSENPTLQKIVGNNIREKVCNIERADWGMSTDLESVFNLILDTASEHKVPSSDMPDTIYIVSDMEFNEACTYSSTLFETIKLKYESSNYVCPKLVFWNVNARNTHVPVKFDDNGTCLISGCSPSILTSLLSKEEISPERIMYNTINAERYDSIVL